MTEPACRFMVTGICETHWPKEVAALDDKRLEPLRPTSEVCTIGLTALRAELKDTVKELQEWESRAIGFKEERDTLRTELEEQARLIVRLRGALEEGLVRHLELDRWTRERVETDLGAYIHVIRKALSPTMEPTEA